MKPGAVDKFVNRLLTEKLKNENVCVIIQALDYKKADGWWFSVSEGCDKSSKRRL